MDLIQDRWLNNHLSRASSTGIPGHPWQRFLFSVIAVLRSQQRHVGSGLAGPQMNVQEKVHASENIYKSTHKKD